MGKSTETKNGEAVILPQIKHTLKISEEGSDIVVDISDETGGLGLKLYFDSAKAHNFGHSLMDRARYLVSNGSDDPKRNETQEFTLRTGDIDRGYPHAAQLTNGHILSEAEISALHCGHEGCTRGWQTEGGLVNVGFGRVLRVWRCQEHREYVDHSSHRLDLRLAVERATNAALRNELEKCAKALEEGHHDHKHVVEFLRDRIKVFAEKPAPAPKPPSD